MPPRFPIVSSSSSEVRSATLLLSGAIVITGLYVGREVLLPLAFAILLSFVLTPALLFLRRLKVPRVLGVTIVVASAFALIFALGWLISQQATQLAEDLPRYQHVLAVKIAALRKSAAASPVFEKAADAMRGLERELTNPKLILPLVRGSTRPLEAAGLTSRFRSRSASRSRSPGSSIRGSLGPCCHRSPRPASSFSSLSLSCCSARICATGRSVCSAPRTCSAPPPV